MQDISVVSGLLSSFIVRQSYCVQQAPEPFVPAQSFRMQYAAFTGLIGLGKWADVINFDHQVWNLMCQIIERKLSPARKSRCRIIEPGSANARYRGHSLDDCSHLFSVGL